MKRLGYILFALVFSFSCTSPGEQSSDKQPSSNVIQWPDGVMYEIFVQSFADADGDGIGDIRGMMTRLDYLQDLGIKGIWLMPVMPSPSYHKYDVTDYYNIHPDYGNLAIFKEFVREAHKRDIKVVIDMVINHTSNQHPWFLNAMKGDTARYRNYYIWATDEEIAKISAHEKAVTGDSDNKTQWHTAPGNKKKYYGFFTGMMPDLNYDNAKVHKEVIDIGKFWLEQVGVDGFRLDAARHIYEESRMEDNYKWWVEYRTALQQTKPDIYLVGEVWDDVESVAPFLKGLPALFNFDLAFSMLESIRQGRSLTATVSGASWRVIDTLSLEKGYLRNQSVYKKFSTDYHDAIFLSNHDQNRILSMLDGDIRKGKLAASLLLTMPGTPYIYYGEEIGMKGRKPDPNIREPYLWAPDDQDSMRARWIEPVYTTTEKVAPLSTQKNDPNSIYTHYRRLIHIRNNSEALTHGSFIDADYGDESIISFYRKTANEELLIFHNLSDQAVSIQLAGRDKSFSEELFGTYGVKDVDDGIDLEPYSTTILISR